MIRRHTQSAIFMHWFNAFCWIFLLFSGFALLSGDMQPIDQWWQDLWQGIFGQRGLLVAHLAVGTIWCLVYALYIVFCARSDVLPFLREITRFQGKSDLAWCVRKGLWLVLGPRRTRRLGINPVLPPQGFYNAGQKMVAVMAVLSSLGLVATGILMGYFSGDAAWAVSQTVLQWCLVLHFACAALMAILLPIHIYMAALAPGEGPALRSMLTGMVPLEHVREHNPLWYAELKASGRPERPVRDVSQPGQ